MSEEVGYREGPAFKDKVLTLVRLLQAASEEFVKCTGRKSIEINNPIYLDLSKCKGRDTYLDK